MIGKGAFGEVCDCLFVLNKILGVLSKDEVQRHSICNEKIKEIKNDRKRSGNPIFFVLLNS